MFNYIRGQWIMAKVSREWVMACVPKFITEEQCAIILATEQNSQLNKTEVQAL